jgi:Fur family peroxide stress response transcriptional regulator
MDAILKKRLKTFEETCRKVRLRLTPQRLEIFRELACTTDHPPAELLHQRLIEKMPTLSLDTVYRTLATFAEHGLVSRVETVDSQARFEVIDAQHHHLICKKCREIIDFYWSDIDNAALPAEVSSWGAIDSKSLIIYGICNTCLQQTDG